MTMQYLELNKFAVLDLSEKYCCFYKDIDFKHGAQVVVKRIVSNVYGFF